MGLLACLVRVFGTGGKDGGQALLEPFAVKATYGILRWLAARMRAYRLVRMFGAICFVEYQRASYIPSPSCKLSRVRDWFALRNIRHHPNHRPSQNRLERIQRVVVIPEGKRNCLD